MKTHRKKIFTKYLNESHNAKKINEGGKYFDLTTRVAAECTVKVYLHSRTREETTDCERGLERSEVRRGTANAAVYEVPQRAERRRAPPLAQAPC